MFAKVDKEGKRYFIFGHIVNHRTEDTDIKHQNDFVKSKNGGHCHATHFSIVEEPSFVWWTPHALYKRSRIIAKMKLKYWTRTHKF